MLQITKVNYILTDKFIKGRQEGVNKIMKKDKDVEVFSEEIIELLKDLDNFKSKQSDIMTIVKGIYLNMSTNN